MRLCFINQFIVNSYQTLSLINRTFSQTETQSPSEATCAVKTSVASLLHPISDAQIPSFASPAAAEKALVSVANLKLQQISEISKFNRIFLHL